MKLSEDVKSISYLKAHAAEVIRDVAENRRTVVITQNGEAKAVLHDVRAWDELQETLALLTMLGQSRKSIREGRTAPIDEAVARARQRAGLEPTT